MIKVVLRHWANCLKFCIILLLLNSTIVFGQSSTLEDPEPMVVIDAILPYALEWSDHEPLLTFGDASLPGGEIETEFDTWYEFDPNQEILVQGNRWPLQIIVPSAIENQVLQTGLSFLSPNERYIVFPSPFSQPEVSQGSEVRIYDSQNNFIINTGISSGGGLRTVGYFDVIWGSDNRFVLSTIPESGGLPAALNLYYIEVIENAISVHLLSTKNLGNELLLTFNVFDVSPDGRKVLLKGGIQGEFESFLAIWDAQFPDEMLTISETQIDVNQVLDARFTSFDGTTFVYLDDHGLGRYSVSTQMLEILNDQINSREYQYAEFSLNGEFIALATDTAVYWLDLRDTLVIPTPTSSPSPTPTATYTPTSPPPPAITATPGALAPLRLTSMCSPDPANVRVWRVRNPNITEQTITWTVVGTQQTGLLTVPAVSGSVQGEAFFQTVTVPNSPNTTRITINGVQQDVKASGTTQCSPGG